MIRLPISPEDLEHAKSFISSFDQIKTAEKMKCNSNYLGPLGEMLFDRLLRQEEIPCEWVGFVKQGYSQEDFNVRNQTVDVKTTFGFGLWIQKATYDIYVLARTNKGREDEMYFIGWQTGKRINKLIREGKAEVVVREGRSDYTIPITLLRPIEELILKWKGGRKHGNKKETDKESTE